MRAALGQNQISGRWLLSKFGVAVVVAVAATMAAELPVTVAVAVAVAVTQLNCFFFQG
jgi:hypothetical protein